MVETKEEMEVDGMRSGSLVVVVREKAEGGRHAWTV